MNYHLFISHAWSYNKDYYNLCNLLDNASNFEWSNYSVPEHDPFNTEDLKVVKKDLEKALRKQIEPVSVVIVIAGMYANYSDWIKFEVNYAIEKSKPIVVVEPRGQEKVPQFLRDNATAIVGWNTNSIVEAIRNCSI